jgi:hypothetical protein
MMQTCSTQCATNLILHFLSEPDIRGDLVLTAAQFEGYKSCQKRGWIKLTDYAFEIAQTPCDRMYWSDVAVTGGCPPGWFYLFAFALMRIIRHVTIA